MDTEAFTYTTGMDEATVQECLSDAETGVLSLASDREAYGVPVAFDYRPDERTAYLRLGEREDSEKLAFLASTDRACLTVYDYADDRDSWSVLLRGPIERVEDDPTVETVNERFPPIRIFGEAIEDLAVGIYALSAEELTGRETA